MNFFSKQKILIWALVTSVVLNISFISTAAYKIFTTNPNQNEQFDNNEIPRKHLMRFFRQELNLNNEQFLAFRTLRRNYMTKGREIKSEMSIFRNEIIKESFNENPDKDKTDSLAHEIGHLHAHLKIHTTNYFSELRKICTPEQSEKLFDIFYSIQNSEPEIRGKMKERKRFIIDE